MFSTGGSYTQVCGRMIGYQVGSTSAFWGFLTSGRNIDSTYVEGVSLTHGTIGARQHIWTFAAGIEESGTRYAVQQCPCDTISSTVVSPSFVGRDYFCESGLHSNWNSGTMYNRLFLDDPLWDGQGCTSTSSTCCQFNNPPWFTRNLTNPTTDDIEMRLCSNQWSQETILLELIELYVK